MGGIDMKKIYQKFKGLKGNGLLLTKYQLEDSTLIRGVGFTILGKEIFSITHANDKGWWDDENGKIHNFHFKNKNLFIRKVVLGFDLLKNTTKNGM